MLLAIVGLVLPNPSGTSAQTLVDLLQERRHRAVADNFIKELGALPARPLAQLPVQIKIDHETSNTAGSTVSVRPREFSIFKVRRIPKLGRGWFQKRFEDVEWAFLGSNELASVDTTFSWKLRGMLETGYGAPTQTITDFGHWKTLDEEQYIQFEYWFVINNDLPFVVTDTNGPFERGIVVSTDKRFASDLERIRNALFDPLISQGEMSPYVDYYYDSEYDTWYRTGYNGTDLFVDSINKSEIGNGRPVLSKR